MCDSKCTNCVKYSSPDNTIIEYMCKDNNFLLVFLEMLVAMIFLLTLIFVYLIVYERYKHDDKLIRIKVNWGIKETRNFNYLYRLDRYICLCKFMYILNATWYLIL